MASFIRKHGRLGLIARLIGRSPVTNRLLRPVRYGALDLPPGYEAIDLFILQWIAAEAMRCRRKYPPL